MVRQLVGEPGSSVVRVTKHCGMLLPIEHEGLGRAIDPRGRLIPVLPGELAPGEGLDTDLQRDGHRPSGEAAAAAADQQGCTFPGQTFRVALALESLDGIRHRRQPWSVEGSDQLRGVRKNAAQ